MTITKEITIINLDSAKDMMRAFPLMQQIYVNIDEESYLSQIEEMIKVNDFRMIGAIYEDQLVGVSGYWIMRMLYCGRYLQASSLAVKPEHRDLGIGRALLRHLEKIARKSKCQKFVLDSYVENKKSHSLYFGENFYIRGFHFMKDL